MIHAKHTFIVLNAQCGNETDMVYNVFAKVKIDIIANNIK